MLKPIQNQDLQYRSETVADRRSDEIRSDQVQTRHHLQGLEKQAQQLLQQTQQMLPQHEAKARDKKQESRERKDKQGSKPEERRPRGPQGGQIVDRLA